MEFNRKKTGIVEKNFGKIVVRRDDESNKSLCKISLRSNCNIS